MIEEFNYYLKNNLVKRTFPSMSIAKSLIRKAIRRLQHVRKYELSEKDADIDFENIYEACREAAQALMAKAEYKPLSHEAVISFLVQEHKDKFQMHEIATFNRYRQLRNLFVYEGKPIAFSDTKAALEFSKQIIDKIKSILGEEK